MDILMDVKNRKGLITWIAERKQGKTYNLCKLSILNCIETNTNSVLITSTFTKLPIDHLLEKMMIKYKYSSTNRSYSFVNGAILYLKTDSFPENLRGISFGFVGIDEAKNIKDLDYLIKSVIYPTILPTDGKVLLASSFDENKYSDFNGIVLDSIKQNNLINTINKLTTT